MSTNNYNSPASLAPEIGFKPDGFLGGMWAGQRNNDYRQAIDQSNLMQALSARQEMDKLQEYGANSPVREAERLSKIAGFNANASSIGDIQGGLAAQGRTQQQTQAGDVEQKLAGWRSKMGVDEQAKIDRQMANMVGIGETLFNSPGHDTLEGQMQRDQLLKQFKTKYPDLGLPDSWSNESEQKIFQQYQHAKTLQQIKQKEDLAKAQLQSATTLQAHEMDNATRIEQEGMKERAAKEKVDNAQAKIESTEKEINKLRAIEARVGSLTPAQAGHLKKLEIDRDTALAMKAIAQGLPPQILNQGSTTGQGLGGAVGGMVQGARQAVSPAEAQSSGPQPGTVDGGYRFKGGNPADKNNWEKI